jgi:hypothetical protein
MRTVNAPESSQSEKLLSHTPQCNTLFFFSFISFPFTPVDATPSAIRTNPTASRFVSHHLYRHAGEFEGGKPCLPHLLGQSLRPRLSSSHLPLHLRPINAKYSSLPIHACQVFPSKSLSSVRRAEMWLSQFMSMHFLQQDTTTLSSVFPYLPLSYKLARSVTTSCQESSQE